MINIRNIIIRELYAYIQKPIIPNTDTQNRTNYPFADYSITSNIPDSGEGNYSLQSEGVDVKETLALQNKIAFSFNVYSKNEVECYNLAKDIWNWFRHIGIDVLSNFNIAVVDVMTIDNRSILEINQYEHRFGFDVIVRYKESIERVDLTIQDYSIKGIVEK